MLSSKPILPKSGSLPRCVQKTLWNSLVHSKVLNHLLSEAKARIQNQDGVNDACGTSSSSSFTASGVSKPKKRVHTAQQSITSFFSNAGAKRKSPLPDNWVKSNDSSSVYQIISGGVQIVHRTTKRKTAEEGQLEWQQVLSGKPTPTPSCCCGQPTVLRSVAKANENRGRKFYVCTKPAVTPIHVDTSDSGGSSPNSASRGGLGQRGAQADRDSPGWGGRSTADASAGGRSSGNDGDNGSVGSGQSGSFISDQELRQLAPTNIPRDRWIPGYHGSVNFSIADVDPWPVHTVRQLSVRDLTVSKLFHVWCRPPLWLFPQRVPVPSPGTWYSELITEANIVALYQIRPWTVLQRVIPPRSFDISGWFTECMRLYVAFEGESLQAYWDATHKLPISKAMKADDPFMAQFWLDRKQRRSRLGPKWQTLLKHLLAGMVAGHCDLDLLLDPFFLHLPRTSEHGFWYPGLGASRAPADLVQALSIVDAANPWRNQYRTNPNDHPGYHIVRLDGNFRTPSNDQVI
ncbi:unnamed protein product [Phytophthora fragariaefolia]|uniref:Unnamed protein product n=1 Tax=Phytophthora fragariaefolia TaxID=1490495 RepID=A0A9W6TXI8_9STRA|nr:unnamed protein product [Phytophthora fragariaefolia]